MQATASPRLLLLALPALASGQYVSPTSVEVTERAKRIDGPHTKAQDGSVMRKLYLELETGWYFPEGELENAEIKQFELAVTVR